jgi:hypothetical protein
LIFSGSSLRAARFFGCSTWGAAGGADSAVEGGGAGDTGAAGAVGADAPTDGEGGAEGDLDSPQPAINPAMPISRKKRMFMRGPLLVASRLNATERGGPGFLFYSELREQGGNCILLTSVSSWILSGQKEGVGCIRSYRPVY